MVGVCDICGDRAQLRPVVIEPGHTATRNGPCTAMICNAHEVRQPRRERLPREGTKRGTSTLRPQLEQLWVNGDGGYSVEPITFGEAQLLIEAGHYLGQLRKSGIQIGLLNGSGIIGAAVYGQPSREGVVRALWDRGTLANTVELLRFYTLDSSESWLGTWFLSRSIKRLPREVEMIVAFSDPAHGHHGGLYQAASWLYTGPTTNTPYHYEDRDGNRIGKQTPWKQAKRERESGIAPVDERPAEGERRVAALRGWRRVKDQPKHRYVYPRSRRARRLLRQQPRPYPKPSQEAA